MSSLSTNTNTLGWRAPPTTTSTARLSTKTCEKVNDYIDDLKDFETDSELSTKDDLMLHNAKTGETVMSYRGTTDEPVGKPKNFVKDWLVNGQIADGSTHTSRAKTTEKQADRVLQKYGKQNLVVTGHSQG